MSLWAKNGAWCFSSVRTAIAAIAIAAPDIAAPDAPSKLASLRGDCRDGDVAGIAHFWCDPRLTVQRDLGGNNVFIKLLGIVRQTLILDAPIEPCLGLQHIRQMLLRPSLEHPERLCESPAKGSNRVLDAERCRLYDPSFQNAIALQTTQAPRERLLRDAPHASFDLIKAHCFRTTAENPQYEDRPFISQLIQEQSVEFDLM
jgi:hypothetical protein